MTDLILRVVACSAFALGASACSHHVGHFRLGSISLKEDQDVATRALGSSAVTADSCGHYFLFIPVSSGPSIEEAYDLALASAPGAQALKDVTIEDRDPLVTVFYNRSCYRVTGTPVALK